MEQTAAERPEEGSQGQAQSEAERAAPGNERNRDQALKGRPKDAEDARWECIRSTSVCCASGGLSFSFPEILTNFLSPFQGSEACCARSRGRALRFALRLPLATFFRASGAR